MKETIRKKIIYVIVMVTILIFSFSAKVQTGQANPMELSARFSLYSDVKAYSIGDVLMVNIVENASATGTSGTQTGKQQEMEIEGKTGTGMMRFIAPFFGKVDGKNSFKGSGQTNRSGKIVGKMTVTVKDLMPNGTLLVEGSRTIEVNDDKEVMTISGLVNPTDVNRENTINSYQIANVKISYKGKGAQSDGSRPGLFMRIINYIF